MQPHTIASYDTDLKALDGLVGDMASRAEASLRDAANALFGGDVQLAGERTWIWHPSRLPHPPPANLTRHISRGPRQIGLILRMSTQKGQPWASAGLRESHVHDVIITKEAPNYRIE